MQARLSDALCAAAALAALSSCDVPSAELSEPDEIVLLDCEGRDQLAGAIDPQLGAVSISYAFNPGTKRLWVFSQRENDWVDVCTKMDCSVQITPDIIRIQEGLIEKETLYWIDRRTGAWSLYTEGACRRAEPSGDAAARLF
jgi:hypothetical protein